MTLFDIINKKHKYFRRKKWNADDEDLDFHWATFEDDYSEWEKVGYVWINPETGEKGGPWSIDLRDLLADDWEIYEEGK